MSSFAGLTFRDLEYLMAVAAHRHFGRAAESCGVSQPALSTQIKKLEGILGVRIFERSPRHVLVTREGEAILKRAGRVLTEARGLLDAARERTAPLAGPFRLGALPTLGPYVLPYVIQPLRGAFPEMRLLVSENRSESLITGLRAGDLDAALLCRTGDDAGLVYHDLFFEAFYLLHLAELRPAWPIAAADGAVVVIDEGHCLHDQVRDACGPSVPYGARRASSLEMLRHMIAAGEGLSLVPALAAEAFRKAEGPTVATPLPDPAIGRDVVLASRRSDPRTEHIASLATLIRTLFPLPVARPT